MSYFCFENIDWEYVQRTLPQKKPISIIQRYYRDSMDPNLKKGKWTEEEVQDLFILINKHGKDWKLISEKIGTHSESHCRLKYRYMLNSQDAKLGKEW